MPTVSVVIAAYNVERTLGAVLEALSEQERPPDEIIVVDDRSTDRTPAIAEQFGARVVRTAKPGYAGGARNTGWDHTTGDVIVFMDADIIPAPGWGAGLDRALEEFPNAVIGCALTFDPISGWDWIGHFQTMTPYLPNGAPRQLGALCSGCLAVPREAPLRWDESYGGEDGVFSAEALAAGLPLVFDPRFSVEHRAQRARFGDLRAQQQRIAYGLARCAPIQREGRHKHILVRVPAYFALVRLPLMYRRVRSDRRLRSAFLRLLPQLIVGEWAMGLSALRYALFRPPLEGEAGGFRRSAAPAAE